MKEATSLPLPWQRAAVLGSLWAANEIVIGSFLHNVGFPFTGTLLSAVGVALLVAGARLWHDAGVIWRAGIVCALMKSLSPSAVILGPMIGILTEAVLLFVFAVMFRTTMAGFILGGSAATLTPIIQKIATVLLAYGFDAARLYEGLFRVVAVRIDLTALTPATALAWFVALNALPGALAAIGGAIVARDATIIPHPGPVPVPADSDGPTGLHESSYSFSLSALGLHVLSIIVGLTAIPFLPALIAPFPVAAYLGIIVMRYPMLRPKFKRPRLWIEFGVVALLAGVVLGALSPEGKGTWWTGLQSGIQMTARAALMVGAFSAISIELRNPLVIDWFLRRGLGRVSAALHMAFRALPVMLTTLNNQRRIVRHPFASFREMLSVMLRQLDTQAPGLIPGPKVHILTGKQGSGKTALLERVVAALRQHGIAARGILSHVSIIGGIRIGYDVQNILTGVRVPLCRNAPPSTEPHVGPFVFLEEGMRFGREALAADTHADHVPVILDEVGPYEVGGQGWASALRTLVGQHNGCLLVVVRPELVEKVQDVFGFTAQRVWEAAETDCEDLVRTMRE